MTTTAPREKMTCGNPFQHSGVVAPFSHSLRAICTVLLDPRNPLLQSERTQGFAADPVYVKGEVFAYVGLPQNLKDLLGLRPPVGIEEL